MTLQQFCTARGLTLEQLAEQASVALATVVKIDQGIIRPNRLTRGRLATALGIEELTLQRELSDARRRREIPHPSDAAWR